MAKYLKRETVLDMVTFKRKTENGELIPFTASMVRSRGDAEMYSLQELLKQCVDMRKQIEVVHCSECVNRTKLGTCPVAPLVCVDDDSFCSNGKEKDASTNN